MLFLAFLFSLVFCGNNKGKILIVLTNHDVLGSTGRPTGWWLSEENGSFIENTNIITSNSPQVNVFTNAGYAVDYVSPKGKKTPCDPLSVAIAKNNSDTISMDYFNNKTEFDRTQKSFEPLKLLFKIKEYVAIFYAGGHGTMWDFPNSKGLQLLSQEIYKKGGVVSAVCHGPSGLINLKVDGEYLIKGKKVTGFSNAEELADHLTKIVPFSLEDSLKKDGCEYSKAKVLFGDHSVIDGRVVTGQNPASAKSTAENIVHVLSTLK